METVWPDYWLFVVKAMYIAIVLGVPTFLVCYAVADHRRYRRMLAEQEKEAAEPVAVIEETWDPLKELPARVER